MNTFNSREFRAFILAGGALLAGVPLMPAQAQTAAPDAAQAPAEDEGNGLGDIVVTAQKRETNLQRTPVAISVLSGEDLKNRGVVSLKSLMDGAVPSLRIAPFASRNSALTVGIRGIVPFDANQPSRDAGVGVYIDGIYLGRSQGLGAALYDIERIEVLKGPQGTLFGRNSTGGALSIVTRKPSGEFHLTQTGGISNYNGYKVETHLDLPSFANVSVKLDAIITKRDGTLDNPMEGEEDYNQNDQRGLHVGVLWEPSDSFSALYDFDVSRDASTPYYMQVLAKSPMIPFADMAKVQPDRVKVADIGVPEQVSLGRTHGHALHLDWTVADGIHVRSISSYRKLSQDQYDNGGAHQGAFGPNANFARYSLADLHQEQYSQELQVVGTLSRLDFVAGAYYYHEKGDDWAWAPYTMRWGATPADAPTRLPTLQAGQVSPYPDRASDAVATSFALYGQATWTPALLNDALHLTAGARYTRDKKHGDLFKVNGVDTNFAFRISSSRVDPTFTLAFDASENIHLYAKWGTAYRAGGANSRSITYRAYDPEEVETSELGFKGEFFDRHVRLNLAAFKTIYKDQQIDFNAVLSAVPGGPTRTTIETVNAKGNGTIKGVEADLTIAPLEGLTLTASYAYTKGDLEKAGNPFKNNALENVFLVYTPENAYSAAIDYSLPLGGATLRAHVDAAGGDGYHSQSSDLVLTDKSFIVNGRLSLADIALNDAADLQISAWSRNLFNEQHTFFKTGTAQSLQLGIYNEPRTYGIEATVRF
ncbi:TonB-dependent receptor [Novosphingobium album (ex Liu et al. 2023)]|uniref:TonB-dependent receptor n=1 Tax=Novosphingobium album (ex Liu et al. 2023) TaxID=3031130 RepID=A0ABT5WN92_9SPHN|nr:TonB-dependent receptor [Novosphingobium album (ex Liu et al. 2023)]MDE8651504.1 TonB-dependent receptor [Novosphingobium album (ex Liu et al. 2023)]